MPKHIYNESPGKSDIVSFYQNGSPIFDAFGITKQVKAFGKTVNLNSGAYLIIEISYRSAVCDRCKQRYIKVWKLDNQELKRTRNKTWKLRMK